VSTDTNQTPEPYAERSDEITEADIKDAAIAYATQFGLQIDHTDCRVELIQPKLVKESGGSIQLSVSKWYVYFTPRAALNDTTQRARVIVKRLAGTNIVADDFKYL